MGTPALLERDEAAKRLHVSLRTVRRYGKTGLIENVTIGPQKVLVTEDSVNALINAGRREVAA